MKPLSESMLDAFIRKQAQHAIEHAPPPAPDGEEPLSRRRYKSPRTTLAYDTPSRTSTRAFTSDFTLSRALWLTYVRTYVT